MSPTGRSAGRRSASDRLRTALVTGGTAGSVSGCAADSERIKPDIPGDPGSKKMLTEEEMEYRESLTITVLEVPGGE